MTVWLPVHCPSCHSTDVVKNGKSGEGKQRFRCQNPECPRCTFILDYSYRACQPSIRKQIPQMAINGSGIRDTARVLKISRNTVLTQLKKTETVKID